jgi:hypothetical protein
MLIQGLSGPVFPEFVIERARIILPWMLERVDDPLKSGGCLVLYVPNPSKTPLLTCFLGNIVEESKRPRYFQFALEKAVRLAHEHPDHATSWESRNPEQMRFGGAIVTSTEHPYSLSFSGFPEDADEAFVIAVALYAGLLTEDYAHGIADRRTNMYTLAFLRKLDSTPYVGRGHDQYGMLKKRLDRMFLGR